MGRKAAPAGKVGAGAGKAPRKSTTKASEQAPKKRIKAAAYRLPVFVREYLVDFNGARAARASGVPEKSARVQASEWLAREDVQQMIQAEVDARSERLTVEADEVARRYYQLATADPRELIEMRRNCCRYCYGDGHRYQYTPRQLESAMSEWQALHKDKQPKAPPFPAHGGTGFDPRRTPNPDCPECFGEGEAQPFIKDTRTLSPQAAMLYAGVKVTKDGLQVLMHDQIGALTHFARAIGMFKQKVELTGKDGGPVEHSLGDVLAALDGADTGVGPAASRG